MWQATLRDLQWRLRRFAIAVIGTALVFGMTLVLAGLANAFRAEARRTVESFHADAWVMRAGVNGVFMSLSVMDADTVDKVRQAPGVTAADPLLIAHQTTGGDEAVDVKLVGYTPGGIGEPDGVDGRLPETAGEVVADDALGKDIDETVMIAGRRLTVVGTTSGRTTNAGQPLIYVRIADAQAVIGEPFVSAVLTKGVPDSNALPLELSVRSNAQTRTDVLRPMVPALQSLDLCTVFLWVVAATVIGSVVYLSALERMRDFAVFKATGATTRTLLSGLVLQAVVVALGAAILAVGVALALGPLFPVKVEIPGRAYLFLPIVAVLTGAVASIAGIRRAVSVDPAMAFGGP